VTFRRDPGYAFYAHYYLAEWRNTAPLETPWGGASIVNFDAGLRQAYQFDPYGSTGNVDEPWYYPYDPGLVLWYRDTSYVDNWTGVHPGHGFLLVVDAHDQAWGRPPLPKSGSLPWNSTVQSSDAAFGLASTPDVTLGYWGTARRYAGLNAVPIFDDGHGYWSNVAPAASTMTPTYGLLLRVLGAATDGSAALVGLGTK
jgi:bacillopeptidase F (M6 metalloprotease family)